MADFDTICELIASGSYARAARLLDQPGALGLAPPAPDDLRDSRRLAAHALVAYVGGNPPQSAALAQRAIGADPQFEFAHFLRAAGLLAQYMAANPGNPLRVKFLREAGVELDEALHLGLQEDFVYLTQARWASLSEDYRTMATAAQAALALNPDNQQAWEARAQGLTGLGQAVTAADELAAAAAGNPELNLPRLRGWAALHGGRYSEAERLLAEALAQSPRDQELHVWHAEAVKARRWWYRPFLHKDLWFERLTPSAKRNCTTALTIGGLFSFAGLTAAWGLVGGVARAHRTAPIVLTTTVLWVVVGSLLLVAASALIGSSRSWSSWVLRVQTQGAEERDEITLPILAALAILFALILAVLQWRGR